MHACDAYIYILYALPGIPYRVVYGDPYRASCSIANLPFMRALEDNVETTVMLQYNRRKR